MKVYLGRERKLNSFGLYRGGINIGKAKVYDDVDRSRYRRKIYLCTLLGFVWRGWSVSRETF